MYGSSDVESFAVSLDGIHDDLVGYFHNIISVAEGILCGYDQRGACEIMANLHREFNFEAILIPANAFGRMLAPRLARRLRTGLVADVTDIRHNGDEIEMIRPAYSGMMLAGITNRGNGPVMMSIRPGVFTYRGMGGLETEVHHYTQAINRPSTMKCLGVMPKVQTCDIRDSEILISGGGGMKRHFSELQRLADELKGQVSASRKIVDQGIAPRSIQVGQSGKTVNPRLYMALGIDGAIQHVEGLKNVETIISVNTSRKAPICSLSDIVVEGDALEFIERLMDRIRLYRNETRGESA